MIIGATYHITSVFFMDDGIFTMKTKKIQYNKKKHVYQGFIFIDVLCIKI